MCMGLSTMMKNPGALYAWGGLSLFLNLGLTFALDNSGHYFNSV
jgi:hypothetical protein